MRIAIVEDETEARKHLQTTLRKIDSTISVTASLGSIAESVNYFQNQPLVDLVLMDIELSDGQGFEIFERTTNTKALLGQTSFCIYRKTNFLKILFCTSFNCQIKS
jgi:two-component system, LytTR family, response regulator LytT